MKRREFIAGLGGAAAAWPLVTRAQQKTKPITIGMLDQLFEAPRREDAEVDGFWRGLAELGFSESDITIDYRTTEGHPERLSAIVADLVSQRPALILASTGGIALAAKAATRDIPIIFLMGNDPVELGLVASLSRPAGNITGVAVLSTELAEKRLELLHKAVPVADTIALLVGPADSPYNRVEAKYMQSAAGTLGLRSLAINVTADSEITPVFTTLVEQRASAIVVGGSVIVGAKRDQILSLAARFALPTMFEFSPDARAGGLLSYGPEA
jgi:putative tryptophan/tyrosine transport system substrate-binding protein